MDYLYNRQFDKAEEINEMLENLYPGHPVNYLYRANITYWKNYPLTPASQARKLFEDDLLKCMELAGQRPYSEQYVAESLLANICSRGLLLLFFSENDLSINVIPLVTGTYKYLMRSFDFVSSYGDFYYFTGVYNYYREAYPRIHPVYKPLASLFPPGNLIKGLQELTLAAEMSIFLKAESYSLLSWIYTGFENDHKQALFYSKKLIDLYPENLMFRALHIKNLFLLKDLDKAESFVNKFGMITGNSYYDGQILIFNGLLQEKKYKNYDLARQYYEMGIGSVSLSGHYGNEYCAYAYFGLNRICEFNGDKTGKKVYRKKGSDLIDFKKVNFD